MRKIMCKAVVACAGLAVFAVPQARAWNAIGHEAVAYVAYQQMTPATKARVKVLLALNPHYTLWLSYIPAGATDDQRDLYVFMMAATWADEIKGRDSGYNSDGPDGGNRPPPDAAEANRNTGYTDKAMHKYWHFIDTPFAVDHLPLPAIPTPNAKTQIELFRTVLASDASDALKSYDLVWIEHMVGDIHQPLHASTRVTTSEPEGDAGGNSVKTIPPPNLHAFWDGQLGGGYTQDFATAVKAAQALPAADATLAADTLVADWCAEGLKAAESTVYSFPPIGNGLGPYSLTEPYPAAALEVAKQRVALAGARLAKLLNDNLK